MFNPRRKQKNQPGNNYAFIDSQNLNLGTQKVGWKMDWRRFRQYLADKQNVSKAFMFIGYMPEFEEMYQQLHDAGYLIVLKPTQDLSKHNQDAAKGENNQPKTEDKKLIKGNIDADLVLWCMKELRNYNRAIIVSGDGDFHGLIEYLVSQNKLQSIMTPNWQYSHLLKEFDKYIVRIDKLRDQLAYRDRSKPRRQEGTK